MNPPEDGLKLQLGKHQNLTQIERVELRTPDGHVLQIWESVDGRVDVPPFGEVLPPRFRGSLVAVGRDGDRPAEQTVMRWGDPQ